MFRRDTGSRPHNQESSRTMKRVSPNHPSLHGLSVAERKEIVRRRRWANYDERKRKADRRHLIASVVIVIATARFAPEPYIWGAVTVFAFAMIPYMKPR